jgi:hypothetical protein
MATVTARALALGVATDLLVAVAARVVVFPLAFVVAAVPVVCAGGVLAGLVTGTTLPDGDDVPVARLGALAGGAGGVVLGASLWAGMATLVPLPTGTSVWGVAYLFATAGPVTASSSTLVADLWVAALVGGVVAAHAAGGALGARLAVRRRSQ